MHVFCSSGRVVYVVVLLLLCGVAYLATCRSCGFGPSPFCSLYCVEVAENNIPVVFGVALLLPALVSLYITKF